MKLLDIDVELIGHDSFRIKDAYTTIYIDPFRIPSSTQDADLILVTHDHYDHFSPNDINKVKKGDTAIIAYKTCGSQLSGENVKLVSPGDSLEEKNVKIEAVYAYNTNKTFHPKGNGVGYLLELSRTRVYHAGDTDLIPEMKDLKGKADIALLPVSGTYVMNWQEAVEAARLIQPKFAIPMHYGAIVGTRNDAESFKSALEGTEIEVQILR
jgi:L-ascorbate metabolism protein UlaG (beta-lactamase superfamily)